MFRRPGKNTQDENNIYHEDNSPFSKYGVKKNEAPELNQRLFEPSLVRPTPLDIDETAHKSRDLSNKDKHFSSSTSAAHKYRDTSHSEENWSHTKSATLPHHFDALLQEESPETTLGEGVTFRGQLSFERFLRIDGSFEGELLSQGKVIVGPKGKVKANLNLREAIIEGSVEGNITVQEKLELRGEAKVTGDIIAKALCVDEGVSISGHVLVAPPTEELPTITT